MKRMNRATFWLVWLVGGGPMVLAMMLYFTGYGPQSGTQRGALLPAGQSLEQWQMPAAGGAPLTATGRWQLLLTSPGSCEARCQYWQQQLTQVYRALGKEQGRVEWQLLVGHSAVASGSSSDLTPLGEWVWVADPHGNLVLRYPLAMAPEDLLRDLRRLLKVSRIG